MPVLWLLYVFLMVWIFLKKGAMIYKIFIDHHYAHLSPKPTYSTLNSHVVIHWYFKLRPSQRHNSISCSSLILYILSLPWTQLVFRIYIYTRGLLLRNVIFLLEVTNNFTQLKRRNIHCIADVIKLLVWYSLLIKMTEALSCDIRNFKNVCFNMFYIYMNIDYNFTVYRFSD